MQQKIEITAELENWEKVRDHFEDYLKNLKAPLKTICEAEIVLEELFVNICNHAYKNKGGKVEILYSLDPEFLIIGLKDHGDAFNPFEYPDPDLSKPIEERPIGGLGIYLVKEYVNEYQYSYDDGMNNLLLKMSLDTNKEKSGETDES